MAGEHRMNLALSGREDDAKYGVWLAVEALHGPPDSTLGVAQRSFDVVEVARYVVALDGPPPIGHIDHSLLQVSQHGHDR